MVVLILIIIVATFKYHYHHARCLFHNTELLTHRNVPHLHAHINVCNVILRCIDPVAKIVQHTILNLKLLVSSEGICDFTWGSWSCLFHRCELCMVFPYMGNAFALICHYAKPSHACIHS